MDPNDETFERLRITVYSTHSMYKDYLYSKVKHWKLHPKIQDKTFRFHIYCVPYYSKRRNIPFGPAGYFENEKLNSGDNVVNILILFPQQKINNGPQLISEFKQVQYDNKSFDEVFLKDISTLRYFIPTKNKTDNKIYPTNETMITRWMIILSSFPISIFGWIKLKYQPESTTNKSNE